MKFLADHMLGSLARWLRFFGFDTVYPKAMDDRKLVELAVAENRIILTRDQELSKNNRAEALYIKSSVLDEQIREVFSAYNLRIDNEMSRCSLCNTLLEDAPKESVKGKVPEKVFQLQEEFWYCATCDKYYWRGTHWDKIAEKVKSFK